MSFLGEYFNTLEEEWNAEGLEPRFGSVKDDLMVHHWLEHSDPADEFIELGFYDEFKELVHKHCISGTFYTPARDVDQSGHLTQWYKSREKAERAAVTNNSALLKLEVKDVPGLDCLSCDEEVILGECFLEHLACNGNVYTVAVKSDGIVKKLDALCRGLCEKIVDQNPIDLDLLRWALDNSLIMGDPNWGTLAAKVDHTTFADLFLEQGTNVIVIAICTIAFIPDSNAAEALKNLKYLLRNINVADEYVAKMVKEATMINSMVVEWIFSLSTPEKLQTHIANFTQPTAFDSVETLRLYQKHGLKGEQIDSRCLLIAQKHKDKELLRAMVESFTKKPAQLYIETSDFEMFKYYSELLLKRWAHLENEIFQTAIQSHHHDAIRWCHNKGLKPGKINMIIPLEDTLALLKELGHC